ncbi:MAG TPA: hypothetical protein VM890_15690 [Longimicrobium sp.]|nr:hypothetical protein [Longimicrobium sp.]
MTARSARVAGSTSQVESYRPLKPVATTIDPTRTRSSPDFPAEARAQGAVAGWRKTVAEGSWLRQATPERWP